MDAGAVGSHVWTDSSASVELRYVYASYEGSSPTSGSTCRSFDRSALTDDQRAELENLTLVPLTTACNFADGYDYYELTIIDSNGSQAVYRTTGCSYLNLPAAQAMLPPTFSPSVFASGGAGCLN